MHSCAPAEPSQYVGPLQYNMNMKNRTEDVIGSRAVSSWGENQVESTWKQQLANNPDMFQSNPKAAAQKPAAALHSDMQSLHAAAQRRPVQAPRLLSKPGPVTGPVTLEGGRRVPVGSSGTGLPKPAAAQPAGNGSLMQQAHNIRNSNASNASSGVDADVMVSKNVWLLSNVAQ